MTTHRLFLYLRLRIGARIAVKTKVCEFAALGRHMARLVKEVVSHGSAIFHDGDQGVPALEYVEANSERVLISFWNDLQERERVIEGCIPPHHQERLLDPEQASLALEPFVRDAAGEGASESELEDLAERMGRSSGDVMSRIREVIDDKGNFEVRIPLVWPQ